MSQENITPWLIVLIHVKLRRQKRPESRWAQALAPGGSQRAHLISCVNVGKSLLSTPPFPYRRLPQEDSLGFFVVRISKKIDAKCLVGADPYKGPYQWCF